MNLALHVTGRRADGYHRLDSLVAFAAESDAVSVAASDVDSLTVTGPFAGDVPAGEENILVAALRLARGGLDPRHGTLGPLAVRLDKRLPVASGIGGGSADAAALLRIVAGAVPLSRTALAAASLRLGADVPMCFAGTPCRIGGIGEAIEPLAAFPEMAAVLVNPAVAVSTPEVFRLLACRDNPPLPAPPAEGFAAVGALVAYLGGTRNDLEAPALSIAPIIVTATAALLSQGALFARMSGSGATVFGLFVHAEAAERAARSIARREPGWWVAATTLSGSLP